MKTGRKQTEWIRDRSKLIEIGIVSGRITIRNGTIEGRCEDCKEWKALDPDHEIKRSQGGTNDPENIKWRCRECHNKLDNMPDSKKQTGKKALWQNIHYCINCHARTGLLICQRCGKISTVGVFKG